MAKVMVVEDAGIIAKDLAMTLTRLGYSVPATAAEGGDAIRKAEEHRPDLVLMDIHLAGAQDGIAVATELRARLDIPVVYLTAHADEDTLARARESEPFGYLVKPFNERELRGTIEVALHKHQTDARRRLLRDRMVSLGTMTAGIAHELNTPLAYVSANLGFAANELAGAEAGIDLPAGAAGGVAASVSHLRAAHTALDEASVGADRLRRIVTDLRTFARGDDARRSRVELWQVLETALRLCNSQLQPRATIVRSAGPAPPVHASAARLEQVFVNLLVNAAQALPEADSQRHQIRVSTRTDAAGHAVVEIADTGHGIAPEDLPHIFESFFTTKAAGLGSGLGLAICRNILTELGGDIAAESARNRGTVFRVTLPPAPAASEEPPPGPQARSVTVAPRTDPGAPAQRSARLLVVDDEPLVLAMMERMLGRDHDVALLRSAAETLESIRRGERFDVILCDLMMSPMSGMDLFEAVEGIAPEQASAFVFVSGGATSPRSSAFLATHAARHLAKPFTRSELLETIDARLQKAG